MPMSDDLTKKAAMAMAGHQRNWKMYAHRARAAIAVALEEAAKKAECVVAYGASEAIMREKIAAAIRELIPAADPP